ncbi:MurR/RpiR family transcriptional regulator [Paenibacillus hubeiensis]|uniref:MurR/RpiR family transcriptional regulator n=1 Tax=Paenibacillus hubeiensis TaxID=3077330 RepID=UPI0031BAC061
MLLLQMKYAQHLTTQEKHIVDYILQHPEAVFHSTAQELAHLTFTSSSTIVRLCKKLGTKGYPDFQLKLALETVQAPSAIASPEVQTPEFGNVQTAIESVPYLYQQAVAETRRMLNGAVIERIVGTLKQSSRIDIYGSDVNYDVARQACTKWNELGLPAIAHNTPNRHYLNTVHAGSATVSFVISHTGENPAMIEAASLLSGKRMNVIAVTGNNDSTLAKQCDETLLTYAYSDQLRLSKMSSMLSVMYIFDILYMCSIDESDNQA